MPVRYEKSPELLSVLLKIGHVGYHKIYAEHLFVREAQAAVYDDDILSVLYHRHIFSYLAHPAERYNL